MRPQWMRPFLLMVNIIPFVRQPEPDVWAGHVGDQEGAYHALSSQHTQPIGRRDGLMASPFELSTARSSLQTQHTTYLVPNTQPPASILVLDDQSLSAEFVVPAPHNARIVTPQYRALRV
jgi:hypothetical protein